jgi:hypothetical protein
VTSEGFPLLRDALKAFATATATQGQEHIRPFHQYVATRLVVEGGFHPDEVTPHPPLKVSQKAAKVSLEYDPAAQTTSERTVFGGMKTKKIDVVVSKEGVGPVVAISVKGTLGAYRNLVNRMEEAIGDSTNLHVMYPGLVYGFLHLLRANREAGAYDVKDMGLASDGSACPMIQRYYAALCEMTGRRFVRNDYTRYESVGLAVIENGPRNAGEVNPDFPPPDSSLRIEPFFARVYEVYDLRFPFRGEGVPGALRREWSQDSPLFSQLSEGSSRAVSGILGYEPRLNA